MASLGQMLQAKMDKDEEIRLEQLRAEEAAKKAEEDRVLAVVQNYFDEARRMIDTSIRSHNPIPTITLGKRFGCRFDSYELGQILKTYSWADGVNAQKNTIMDPTHKFNQVWVAFDNWATENDLSIGFTYERDGGNIESWFVMTIKPNPNTF
jgi:hypothetical protein